MTGRGEGQEESGYVWRTSVAAMAAGAGLDVALFVLLSLLTIALVNLVRSMHSRSASPLLPSFLL